MPWTYTFHRQAMLKRTTRILKPIASRTHFHGATIKMLWLKRSCYDLKRSQRFHANARPLQWLKTKCYDLTLPLVPSNIGDLEQHSTHCAELITAGWCSLRPKSVGYEATADTININIVFWAADLWWRLIIHGTRFTDFFCVCERMGIN